LSLAEPDAMEQAAQEAAAKGYDLLKTKLGSAGDLARLQAVRRGAPGARLIVDANEGLSLADLKHLAPVCADLGVTLIEQPLPAAEESALADYASPVPLCADESAHTAADLARLAGLYQSVNIKLEKTGGLTEALVMAREAKALGLSIMAGCMVGTSLAMAPAVLLTGFAEIVDLDGPLLLADDRVPGLRYQGAKLYPPSKDLWG
jgi:L-Ala-D/L-Glu epimerase